LMTRIRLGVCDRADEAGEDEQDRNCFFHGRRDWVSDRKKKAPYESHDSPEASSLSLSHDPRTAGEKNKGRCL
jgi:hypothetical protein